MNGTGKPLQKRHAPLQRFGVQLLTLFVFALFATVTSCVHNLHRSPQKEPARQEPIPDATPEKEDESPAPGKIEHIRYTIQAGAFSQVDNAVRLTDRLQEKGMDAYYFRHESGLYKVRFGDYPDASRAKRTAEELKSDGRLQDFFIVRPEEQSASQEEKNPSGLREKLVKTARQFLGTPYKWGGAGKNGVDCSGLAMAVYRYNGLKLPRVASAQYQQGRRLSPASLQKGDLVFFATAGGRSISHVGIYVGNNKFIHAPGRGKRVKEASLKTAYFKRTYVGACTYL